MVATQNFWVAMNWASSGAMVMGWNLARSPSTAMSRLFLCRSRQRALRASAVAPTSSSYAKGQVNDLA